MDALMIRKFFSNSNNDLPNSSVSVKEDSYTSIKLQSVLLRILRRSLIITIITKLGALEKKVRSWFDIHTTIAKRVNTVLKIVIDFIFT